MQLLHSTVYYAEEGASTSSSPTTAVMVEVTKTCPQHGLVTTQYRRARETDVDADVEAGTCAWHTHLRRTREADRCHLGGLIDCFRLIDGSSAMIGSTMASISMVTIAATSTR